MSNCPSSNMGETHRLLCKLCSPEDKPASGISTKMLRKIAMVHNLCQFGPHDGGRWRCPGLAAVLKAMGGTGWLIASDGTFWNESVDRERIWDMDVESFCQQSDQCIDFVHDVLRKKNFP